MKRLIIALAITAIALVSACSSETKVDSREAQTNSACETAVRNKMKDPESVQFRSISGFWYGEDSYYTGGEYNAKNGYGAFVGFKSFYCKGFKPAVDGQGDWKVLDYPGESAPTKQSLCDLYNDQSKCN